MKWHHLSNHICNECHIKLGPICEVLTRICTQEKSWPNNLQFSWFIKDNLSFFFTGNMQLVPKINNTIFKFLKNAQSLYKHPCTTSNYAVFFCLLKKKLIISLHQLIFLLILSFSPHIRQIYLEIVTRIFLEW